MEAARALEEQLGAPPPPGIVAALTPAELERLAAVVREARREQRRALARAGEEALRHVPRLLRPAVRKAVGL
jgi:hypothetical protein